MHLPQTEVIIIIIIIIVIAIVACQQPWFWPSWAWSSTTGQKTG